MLRIVLSPEKFIPDEVQLLTEKLQQYDNIDFFHLRKPQANTNKLSNYIKNLPENIKKKTVIHRHQELAAKYRLAGYHLPFHFAEALLKQNLPLALQSISVHSFDELLYLQQQSKKRLLSIQYVFLSPIFDSISKKKYLSKFKQEELKQFLNTHTFNFKIIALGGVTQENAIQTQTLGFDGYALLGDFWK